MVPSGSTLVWLQVVIAAEAVSAVAPGFGFRYTPDGWTDYIEHFTNDVRDDTVDEKFTVCLPLAASLTGGIKVVQIDNGVGDDWSYFFYVFGYA